MRGLCPHAERGGPRQTEEEPFGPRRKGSRLFLKKPSRSSEKSCTWEGADARPGKNFSPRKKTPALPEPARPRERGLCFLDLPGLEIRMGLQGTHEKERFRFQRKNSPVTCRTSQRDTKSWKRLEARVGNTNRSGKGAVRN